MEQEIKEFITYLKEVKGASNNTIQAYQNDLKKLMMYLQKMNVTSVSKITETHLNSFVLSLEKECYSPASVNQNIAAMKAFLLYLMKQGRMIGDPSDRIKPPKVRKKAPQVLSIEHVEQLLEQPNQKTNKGLRDKAMMELLYATGMKVTELISLKLEDINLIRQYATCGERAERNIPIGKPAVHALKEYLNVREAFNKNASSYLFMNQSGQPLSRQGFWKILKTYAKEAGLVDIKPNTIRHSFAAHMFEKGADLGVVQELLGHADISTTQLLLSQGYKNNREVYLKTHPRA